LKVLSVRISYLVAIFSRSLRKAFCSSVRSAVSAASRLVVPTCWTTAGGAAIAAGGVMCMSPLSASASAAAAAPLAMRVALIATAGAARCSRAGAAPGQMRRQADVSSASANAQRWRPETAAAAAREL